MVGMVKTRIPKEGVVLMAEVRSKLQNEAFVHLVEYDVGAKLRLDIPVVEVDAVACRIKPVAVGRIEPMMVVSSLRVVFRGSRKAGQMRKVSLIRPFRFLLRKKRILEIRRVAVSRDVSVDGIYQCEGIFAMRKYVKDILSAISIRTDRGLERVYSSLGWPQDLHSLQLIVASPPTLDITPDLLVSLRYCLLVMNRFFWLIENPFLLAPTWTYPEGWCWAVALARQFEALLKKKGLLPTHMFLSVQDLMNETPVTCRTCEGDIDGLEYAAPALLRGITTEEYCPYGSTQRHPDAPVFKLKEMDVYYDSDSSAEEWDQKIDEQCNLGPFAASVLWFESYRGINASEVYMYRPNAEEREEYARDPISEHLSAHTMLFTGKAVDKDGVAFVQFQDTTKGDLNNGDRGFIRFMRHDPCPVVELVQMELLPASEYPIL